MESPQTPDGTEHSVDEIGVKPVPVRYWWLKRILITAGILLAAVLGLRFWWGWEAHRRLQAEIDKYVAAGEPIYPKDFDSKWVPDDQNAVKVLSDAAAALDLNWQQMSLLQGLAVGWDEMSEQLDEVAEIVESNTRAFDLIRQARAAPAVDWGVRIRSPAVNYMLPPLSGQRNLARLLYTASMYHHLGGNHSAALETLRDMLAQAQIIDAHTCLITHLVAISIESLAARQVEAITPSLGVVKGATGGSVRAPQPVALKMEALILELLEEEPTRDALIRAMLGERMMQLDLIQSALAGNASLRSIAGGGVLRTASWWERPIDHLFAPLLELDGVNCMRRATNLVEVCDKPNWPTVRASSPPEPSRSSPLDKLVHPITASWTSSMDRAILSHFRGLAKRRMAAIALAIRLFEIDHGEPPEVLGQLTPEYLSAIPLDPFADDAREIAYKPQQTPPVLYSIGPDGVDDGGAYMFRSGRIHWNKLDIPFFLDGHRPREGAAGVRIRPISPEAGEDDDDEEESQRNNAED